MKELIIDFTIRTEDGKIRTSYDMSKEYNSGTLTEDVLNRIFKSGQLSIFRYLKDEMNAIF